MNTYLLVWVYACSVPPHHLPYSTLWDCSRVRKLNVKCMYLNRKPVMNRNTCTYVQAMGAFGEDNDKPGWESTVGSHLSELQLSEHVGYLNPFSKATPTISGYFCRVSGLALPVVWQLKTQDNFYGQGRLRNKGESNCQSHPLGTASLPHEMETEQRLTVVRILLITT